MIEILVLIFLTRSIGRLALRKGLSPGTWKFYSVLAWFLGEIGGLFLGVWLFGTDRLIMLVLTAIPCAIAGYHVVRSSLERKPDLNQEDINHIGDQLLP